MITLSVLAFICVMISAFIIYKAVYAWGWPLKKSDSIHEPITLEHDSTYTRFKKYISSKVEAIKSLQIAKRLIVSSVNTLIYWAIASGITIGLLYLVAPKLFGIVVVTSGAIALYYLVSAIVCMVSFIASFFLYPYTKTSKVELKDNA